MTIEELSARLQRVERTNRRMKAAGVLALVLAAAGASMGQAVPHGKVVRAEQFEVVDGEGKVRACLGLAENNTVRLLLGDTDGRKRAYLAVTTDGSAALLLSDAGEKPRVSVGATKEGCPVLECFDSRGSVLARLAASRDGFPALHLFDRGGAVRVRLALGHEGTPMLGLADSSGQPRAVLGVTEIEATNTGATEQTAPSSLVLFDKDGKVLERLPK